MRLSGSFVCADMHLIDLCLLRAIPAHAESQSADEAPRQLRQQQGGGSEVYARGGDAERTTLTGV